MPTRLKHSVYFDRARLDGELVTGTDQLLIDSVPSEWHTNSTVAANPADPNNLIAAWCSEFDPATPWVGPFRRVSVSYTVDGGVTWRVAALPSVTDRAGSGTNLGHPVVGFGPDGVAFLLVVEGSLTGHAHIFRSVDNGATWTATKAPPSEVSFPWLACDPSRPGRLYVCTGSFRHTDGPGVWPMDASVIWRSDDACETWSAGTVLNDEGSNLLVLSPHVSVADDGTVHIVFATDKAIRHCRSIDFGETFTVQRAAGPLSLSQPSPVAGDLRVCGCATAGRFVVSWADSREGVSRVYYRATDVDSLTWVGPDAGTPLLLGQPTTSGAHHFRPRLAATAEGTVGCAFYELTPGLGRQSLTMMQAVARRLEDGFSPPVAVSDVPWTPASAPDPESLNSAAGSEPFRSHYFGLAADASSFLVVWPQTPAGQVPQQQPPIDPDLWIKLPAGGWIVIRIRNGKLIKFVRVPRPSPPFLGSMSDLERALRTLEATESMNAGNRVHEPNEIRALGRILKDVAVLVESADLSEQRVPAKERKR